MYFITKFFDKWDKAREAGEFPRPATDKILSELTDDEQSELIEEVDYYVDILRYMQDSLHFAASVSIDADELEAEGVDEESIPEDIADPISQYFATLSDEQIAYALTVYVNEARKRGMIA